jgi:hypothetical protein
MSWLGQREVGVRRGDGRGGSEGRLGREVRRGLVVCLAGLTVVLAARGAHAQSFSDEAMIVEGEGKRFRSAQLFAFELRFGPYRPDIDGEFNGVRHPYQDYFGSGDKLLTQIEFDYELFHGFGTAAVGFGLGYFQVTGTAPVADGTGAPSGDTSTLKVLPLSLSGIYRFDYFLEMKKFPLVPFVKLGLDYGYWQITNGNGDIATDGKGGHGRGGTPGWHAAGGFELVLDMFDPEAARDFDSDLGVNHTALVFQYSYANISGLGTADKLHLGDINWSLGLLIEF